MPLPGEDYSISELARLTSAAMQRLESLAQRLEGGQFVRSDLFHEYRDNVNQSLSTIKDRLHTLDKEKTEDTVFQDIVRRVKNLEDGRTWLIRLVGAFVVIGALQAVFVVAGLMGGLGQ